MTELKVLKFSGETKLGIRVEDVLEENKDLDSVYLIGFKDGEMMMATSEPGSWGDILLILEMAKACIIREAFDLIGGGGR